MNQSELNKILEEHKKWLMTDGKKGKRANLRSADLSSADLSYANLHYADLSYANLSYANLRSADLSSADLSYANLHYADLSYANLRYADLRSANLSYANLSYANLSSANLRSADLSSADLDYSVFPLWCGSLDVHIDDRQATQLLYHLVKNVLYSKNTSDELKALMSNEAIINKANEFHRVNECGLIAVNKERD